MEDGFLTAGYVSGLVVRGNDVTLRPGASASVSAAATVTAIEVTGNSLSAPNVLPAGSLAMDNIIAGQMRRGGGAEPRPGWSTSITADIGSVAAHSCDRELSIDLPRAERGALCVTGTPEALQTGVLVHCSVSGPNSVRLRFCNVTPSPLDPPPATYLIRVIEQ